LRLDLHSPMQVVADGLHAEKGAGIHRAAP
jgi:hypothetical protein